MSNENDRAKDQALAQVASITGMVAALEVDYDHLQELREWMNEEDDDRATMDPEAREELQELEAAAGDCADRDEAAQRISEDPLSLEVRSGWESAGGGSMTPSEFRIVLCTGGPHVEIVGELNNYLEPESVRIIYKDWGTSGELFGFDREPVLTYCRQFYFGE